MHLGELGFSDRVKIQRNSKRLFQKLRNEDILGTMVEEVKISGNPRGSCQGKIDKKNQEDYLKMNSYPAWGEGITIVSWEKPNLTF